MGVRRPSGRARPLAALALAAALAAPAAGLEARPQGPEGGGLRIRHLRFWREDATLLEGRIGLAVRPGDAAARTVELVVRDAAGNVLHRESWEQAAPARAVEVVAEAAGEAGVEVTTPFAVALAPGTYTIVVTARSGSAVDSARAVVESFTGAPLLSDLVLSSRVRVLGEGEEPGSAEMRKGRYAIEQGTRVTLTPTAAKLWYYFELYAPGRTEPAPVTLRFAVWPADGRAPLVRSERQVTLAPPGGAEAAGLDLAGLPPGDYRLVVEAVSGGRTERREAEFTMAGFEAERVLAAAQPAAAGARESAEAALYERYFSPRVRDNAEIGQLIEALIVATPGERAPGSVRQLSPEGQRRFLARYWARLQQGPAATEAERAVLEEWLERVDYVSRQYGERDIGRPGVQTDRGRIYLKYGPPDEKLAQPMSGNREIEVWKYTRRRNLKYIFLDESGFQHFRLIATTDPTEPTMPDWIARIGDAEIVRLVTSF